MRFLDGPAAKATIKELLPKAERIRVAVAYWGAGAVDQLAIADLHGRDMIILCDLMSGGCNPEEIRRLQEILGEQRVLTRNRLHAKVWLTDRGAILGSSNASANGLGHQRDETKGLVEANILVEDRFTLASIERWFEGTASLARVITEDDLKRATELWKHHRATRPPLSPEDSPFPPSKSLLEALTSNPEDFDDRNLVVWVWSQEDSSAWAKRIVESQKLVRKNSKIDYFQDVGPPFPHFGTCIVDFDTSANGGAK